MAITPYAAKTDLEHIWSSYGVAVRSDDRDTFASADIITAVLEKGACDMNFYLFKLYTLAQVRASTWAKWVNAVLSCVELARRRGNSVPTSLQTEYDRYLEQLKAIADGSALMPSDTGMSAGEFDVTAFVTNLTVDTRFGAPVRRVRATSTNAPQAPSRKGNDAVVPNYLPY